MTLQASAVHADGDGITAKPAVLCGKAAAHCRALPSPVTALRGSVFMIIRAMPHTDRWWL